MPSQAATKNGRFLELNGRHLSIQLDSLQLYAVMVGLHCYIVIYDSLCYHFLFSFKLCKDDTTSSDNHQSHRLGIISFLVSLITTPRGLD